MIPLRGGLRLLLCVLLMLLLVAVAASPAAAERVVVVTYDVSGSMVPKVYPEQDKDTWRYTMSPEQLKAVTGAVAELVANGWPNLEGVRGFYGHLFDQPELTKGAQAPLWREGDGLVLFTYGQGIVKKYDSRPGGQGLSSPGQVHQVLMENLPYPHVPDELANEYSYVKLRPYYTRTFPGAHTLRDAARLEVYRIYEELYRNHREGQPLPEVIWVDVSDREVDPGSKRKEHVVLREFERYAFRLKASLGLTDFPLYQVTANNRMYIIAWRVSQTADISEEKKQELERLRQEMARIKEAEARLRREAELARQKWEKEQAELQKRLANDAKIFREEQKKTASRLILRINGQIVKETKAPGGVRGEDPLRLKRQPPLEQQQAKGQGITGGKQYLFVLPALKLMPPEGLAAEYFQLQKLSLHLEDKRGKAIGPPDTGPVILEEGKISPAPPVVGKVFAFTVLLNEEQAQEVDSAVVETHFMMGGRGIPTNPEPATDESAADRQEKKPSPFAKRWIFNAALDLPTSLSFYILLGMGVLLAVVGALVFGLRRSRRRGDEIQTDLLGRAGSQTPDDDLEYGNAGPSDISTEEDEVYATSSETPAEARGQAVVPGGGNATGGAPGVGPGLLVRAEGDSQWVIPTGGSLSLRYNDANEALESCGLDVAFWTLTWDSDRLTLGDVEIPHDQPYELSVDASGEEWGESGASVRLTFTTQ